MTTAEESTSALSHFIDASNIRERLDIMTHLNAEMALADSTFESVLAALEADKDLANFIRHAACSAYFGGRDTHCSMAEAFSRMGVKEFYRTVSSAIIHTRMSHETVPHFVAHSDQVARLCEIMASHCAKELSADAYFTGLCHDAAVPTMSESVTDYQYLADQAFSHDPDILELEAECNEFTHCDAGAEIVKLMGFANEVVTAVHYHHEPQRLLDLTGAEAKLLTMVTVSERVIAVSLEQAVGVFNDPTEAEILHACCDALAMDAQQFQALIEEMTQLCHLRHTHA